MDPKEKHSEFSSIREEYVEYMFLAQLCSHAWKTGRFVEIARSNTDAFGYDIILTCEGVVRHVQLKATREGGAAGDQRINENLAKAPGGCVVWMFVENDTLQPIRFGWFGGAGQQPLPDLGGNVARHTKANSAGEKLHRPNIRKVSKSRFDWLESVEQVFERLFPR